MNTIKILKNETQQKGIYINSDEVLFQNVLLSLEPIKTLRPTWFLNVKSNPMYFPLVYKNTTDGDVLVFFSNGKEKFPAVVRNRDKIIFNFNPETTIKFLLYEQYLVAHKLLYRFLPIHYHAIPGRIRKSIKRLLVFIEKRKINKERPVFPNWPFEDSVESIRYILSACWNMLGDNKQDIDFSWPQKKKIAVVLTHDVDTRGGFRNIDKFIRIEKKYGLRSCWFVVGQFFTAHKNQLLDLMRDGFEIGCHGYTHDNKLISLSREKMKDNLLRSSDMLKALDIKGFRSPSLLRSRQLFRVLEDFFVYDTSVPDTEIFLQIAPRSGCCSIFPYKISGNLLELPITLSLDSTLMALGFKPNQIYEFWKEKIGWIKKLCGVAHITTHAELYYSANREMLKVYEQLINFISKDSDCWIATPKETLAWWQKWSM